MFPALDMAAHRLCFILSTILRWSLESNVRWLLKCRANSFTAVGQSLVVCEAVRELAEIILPMEP